MRRWLLGALLASTVALLAYRRQTLTIDGALAAAAVGAVAFARGGRPATAALLAFFTSSSALSRLGEGCQRTSTLAQAKGARRDVWQVLANGGIAVLSLLLPRRLGEGAYVGALAAAGADTWATELGMFAGRQPRLLTSLQPVERGRSGGVTPEGLLASLGGAWLVGVAWRVSGGVAVGVRGAMVAGMTGSLLDSLLGATVQGLYRCPACDQLTEEPRHRRCGQATELVHGRAWVTNDVVNGAATLAGAAIGALSTKSF